MTSSARCVLYASLCVGSSLVACGVEPEEGIPQREPGEDVSPTAGSTEDEERDAVLRSFVVQKNASVKITPTWICDKILINFPDLQYWCICTGNVACHSQPNCAGTGKPLSASECFRTKGANPWTKAACEDLTKCDTICKAQAACNQCKDGVGCS